MEIEDILKMAVGNADELKQEFSKLGEEEILERISQIEPTEITDRAIELFQVSYKGDFEELKREAGIKDGDNSVLAMCKIALLDNKRKKGKG